MRWLSKEVSLKFVEAIGNLKLQLFVQVMRSRHLSWWNFISAAVQKKAWLLASIESQETGIPDIKQVCCCQNANIEALLLWHLKMWCAPTSKLSNDQPFYWMTKSTQRRGLYSTFLTALVKPRAAFDTSSSFFEAAVQGRHSYFRCDEKWASISSFMEETKKRLCVFQRKARAAISGPRLRL